MQQRRKQLMDKGWKFHCGDIKTDPIRGHANTYMASKAERGQGPAAAEFYDGEWETISLPHDYVVSGIYDETENGNHGFLKRDNAWYRRRFKLDEEDKNKRLVLLFDGVATNCTVWVNGHLLYRNFCGYTSFEVDISSVAHYGENINTISVYVDTKNFEGWWYEGAGIYRYVWLIKTNNLSVDTWGTWINPKHMDGNIWNVPVETTLRNDLYSKKDVELVSTIVDIDDKIMATIKTSVSINCRDKTTVNQTLTVNNPLLWDLKTPYLYTLLTEVHCDGALYDHYETIFGFRTIRFDSNKGFFLNNKHVKMKGTSNHQDFGGLGVGLPNRAHYHKINKLKEMGCNAYRSAHNPPSPVLLDACDELGMLVMDENRWFEDSPEALKQLENMLIRDRNHPSIVIWSIGNEEPLQSNAKGRNLIKSMSAFVKKYDISRPITIAQNGGFHEPACSESDIIGINYSPESYDEVHRLYPNTAMVVPESAAARNHRGIYFKDGLYTPAYDEYCAPFGSTHRDAWRYANTREFICGTYVWTGMGYRGEAPWPRLSSGGGGLDLCALEKDNFYLFRAFWCDEPVIHIMPHWNLPGHEGESIKVCVYSNCETVELIQDGKSLGEKIIDPYEQGEWFINYQPGTIKAIGKAKGKPIVEASVQTVGTPVALKLMVEGAEIKANSEDIAIIRVYAVDQQGRFVPTANQLVNFSVNVCGEIIAVGNGDPFDHSSNVSPSRKMFNGLCQIIVRSLDVDGDLTLTASADGLESAELHISRITDTIDRVPTFGNYYYLKGWWISSLSQKRLHANTEINVRDMNSWTPLSIGQKELNYPFGDQTGYVFFRVATKIPRITKNKAKIYLLFEEIVGKAEVCIRAYNADTSIIDTSFEANSTKTSEDAGPLKVELAGFVAAQDIIINLMVEIENAHCGLPKGVRWLVED